jgi:hypothetical protein
VVWIVGKRGRKVIHRERRRKMYKIFVGKERLMSNIKIKFVRSSKLFVEKWRRREKIFLDK